MKEDFHPWAIQFKAHLDLKGIAKWLTHEHDVTLQPEVTGARTCKSQLVLAMKESALIELVDAARTAKEAWSLLVADFEGRTRIRKHELALQKRHLRQKKGESFISYCDRACVLRRQLATAKLSDDDLSDNFILGLSEPFITHNRDRLTILADEQGWDALMSNVKTSTRLSSVGQSRATHGAALAVEGNRRFKGKCFYCGKPGHRQEDCNKKKSDEKKGVSPNRPPPARPADDSASFLPRNPGAAMVAMGHVACGEALAATVLSSTDSNNQAIFDSGCTHYIVKHRKFLTQFTTNAEISGMTMGGGEPHPVVGQGVACLDGGPNGPVILKKVFFVPTMRFNIVSGAQVTKNGGIAVMEDDCVSVQRGDRAIVLTGSRKGGLYVLHQTLRVLSPHLAGEMYTCVPDDASSSTGIALAAKAVPLQVAHERLGHLGVAQIKQVASGDAVTGLQLTDLHSTINACDTCNKAKQTRSSFPPSQSRASKPLEIVHMDTVGKMQQTGFDGSRYAVPIHDEYSSYAAVICVAGKDQIAAKIIELLTYWERQTGYKVVCVRTDNGTEFQGGFDVWCKQQGVHRQYSAPYTPEQNGRAERMNRTVLERTRALLFQRDCHPKFWPLAMEASCYVRNRVPAAGKPYTPFEYMFRRIPDVSLLRVFGCSASLSLPKKKRDGKFGAASVSGTFVGYSEGVKGWRVAVGNTIHESPSVVFCESQCGERSSQAVTVTSEDEDSDDESLIDVSSGAPGVSEVPADPLLQPPPEPLPAPGPQHDHEEDTDADVHDTNCESDTEVEDQDGGEDDEPVRRSGRVRFAPDRFVPGAAIVAKNTTNMPVCHTRKIRFAPANCNRSVPGAAVIAKHVKQVTKLDDFSDVIDPYCMVAHAFEPAGHGIPKNYSDISNFGDTAAVWYAAVKKELTQLTDMNVTEEVHEKDVPVDARILSAKLHMNIKYGPSGEVTEHKARVCARGFQQVEGVDYHETTAPTAAANSTRVLFAEAAYHDWHVHQLDVKAAFLHAPLEETLYMRPPPGIPHLKGVIWRLHKALYGLKQAANAWHTALTNELGVYGFAPTLTDPCLFIQLKGEKRVYLLVYVDDMLLGGDLSDVLQAKQNIAKSFRTKDLGVAYHFLGFLIHRDAYGIRLTQEQYTKSVLERYGHIHAHPKRTPFNEGTAKECAVRCQCEFSEKQKKTLRVAKDDCKCAAYDEPGIDFASFVGSTMFLATRSRPDLANSLGKLSRFVSAPKAFHAPLVKHLLRYLSGTIDWGLFYPSAKYLRESAQNVPKHMVLYTDSDHGGDEKRRSTSGWVIQIHGCTVAWGSKLQTTAVESTCAAEFIAACMGENAAMTLKDLLYEMTGTELKTELLVDNQSAVSKLQRPAGGNMWLDLKWRIVHQRHMDKLVCIRYIPTTKQKADIFTKSLTPILHEAALDMLSMYSVQMKAKEFENAEQRSELLRTGVRVPMKKHACIYKGTKECEICKEFYSTFK